MSGNDPEDNNKKGRDPWGGNNAAPPDLDEALKKLRLKLKKALGGGGSSSGSSGNEEGSGLLIGFFIVVFFVIWALSGIYIVSPAERAVVLRFGKYVEEVGPGPHWIPRFVDSRVIRNVNRISEFSYSAEMLTKDENIVSVSIAVQYRIGNLKNYLFNVSDPEESIRQATASALRQVVGHTSLDDIITKGRDIWGQNVGELLKEILAQYRVGIEITSLSPQPARAPESVQDAFDDAINAQEDEKRYKEKALAYAARVVPIAEGNAKRISEEASAYLQQVVLNAKGAVAEFLAILPQYQQAPYVTRQRMYIETMQKVLTNSSKIVVQGDNGKLFYLPINKMLAQSHHLKSRFDSTNTSSQLDVAGGEKPTIVSGRQVDRSYRQTHSERRSYP